MIHHYITTAIRIMKKRPGFHIINVGGLAIGIAACLMITHYIRYHQSFDKQAPLYEDTYRVLYTRWLEMGDIVAFASCSPPVGPVMKASFPEVESFSRMYRVEGVFFQDDIFFEENRVFYAESPLFDLLGIPIIAGDINSCLDNPGQIALSRSTARKYFAEADPIGKTILFNKKDIYQVSAVFEDLPSNMHFGADIFLSLATWDRQHPGVLDNGWINSGFYTYIRLKQGTPPESIDQLMEHYIDQQMGESLAQRQMGLSYKLQPLKDIHLTSRLMHELSSNSDKTTIKLLTIISWFILFIAWVNFFNLTNIASLKRLREIGLRKVSGAQSRQLFTQFLTESVIINLLALLFAFLLLEIFIHPFNNFAGIPTETRFYTSAWFYVVLFIAFTVGTLSAGVNTGIGISGTNLVNVLKGVLHSPGKKSGMRRILVGFQFIIAIALLSATAGVYLQYRHMLNRDMGFSLEDRIVIKAPLVGDAEMPLKFTAFRNELKQINGIQNCSFSSIIPGKPNMFNRGGFYRQGNLPGESKNFRVTEADNDFFQTMEINFLAGEGFTGNPEIDRDRVVINLNAAKLLEFETAEDAVGDYVHLGNRNLYISGVVVDFFQLSPKEITEPQLFWQPARHLGYFTLDYSGEQVSHMLPQIESLFTNFFPGNPFDYFFLEDFYFAQFQHDRRFGWVFAIFSILVILVTILGLIGLSAYTAGLRKKEIGIRKILGATHGRIFLLLFRDYLLLWIIAAVVAIPIVRYLLDNWLNNFAIRMPVSNGLFIFPMLIVLTISLLTVWIVSRKIIKLNPAENIRTE